MMDRHDEAGASHFSHFDRLLRGAMAADPGVVRADREDREIECPAARCTAVSAKLAEEGRESRIARVEDRAAAAAQDVAVVSPVIVRSQARAPVADLERLDLELAGIASTVFRSGYQPCGWR
jgi:hypothetical protein